VANYDAIIIGAGHNGLVAGAYLARAGKKILLLERRSIVGGIAATEEIFPGYKVPTCAHLAGTFSKKIISDLELERHGLELLPLSPLLFAPAQDGSGLVIPRELPNAAEEIARHSKSDAERFQPFCELFKRLSEFLAALYQAPLRNKANPSHFQLAKFLELAWNFHRLGEKDMHEFLRILPMSIADLLNEWFKSDLLKGALAGRAMLVSFVGPRQQGTAFNFLHHQLGESNGALPRAGFVRGGIGRLTEALNAAAKSHGAELRRDAEVTKIITANGLATGVVLKSGEEIRAERIVSSADVKQTLLGLVEPTALDPHFLQQVKNIRSRGTVAKINLALDGLPRFSSADQAALGGIIHIGPSLNYLERASDDAKYGRFSKRPFLEITIPSIADPSLAPAGKHVMSIWMQSAPYELRESNWYAEREALGDAVVHTIEEYAPGFSNTLLYRQVLTPLDLEETYRLTQGHAHHAEMALDQIFFMRPIPGWSAYQMPINNLYLCGSGTHPGGGITGLPGYYAAREVLKNWRSNS
jgi:phytoene dehydrogenase-like protein